MEALPSVADHPLALRPMPVDYQVCPTKQSEPSHVPEQFLPLVGGKARASVAVFKDTGSEWVPESYSRSPWAVIRSSQKQLYQQVWSLRQSQFSFTDLNNVTRTLNASGGNGTIYNANNTAGVVSLRWGTNSTAATNTDRDVIAFADSLTATTAAYDTTNYTATFSGSKLYTGASTTLREIGQAITFFDVSTGIQTFMQDRTVIADTSVPQNRTVAIEYFWTF